MYVGARHKGVRCEGLWRGWTEDRSNGVHGIGMGRGLSVGQASAARQRTLFFGLFQTRGHGRKDEETSTLFVRRAAKQRRIDRRAQRRGRTLDGQRLQKKDAVPDMLGQVSSSFWV